jgi:Family of unknown function (DUF5681)
MPFVKGQSGNPAGRPRGARNRKTRIVEAMLDAEDKGLVRQVIEQALAGDPTALRLCMERLAPRRRDRGVPPRANTMKTDGAMGSATDQQRPATPDHGGPR